MKFRETRFDATGRVVIAIIAVAALVIVIAVVMRLMRSGSVV